MINLAAGQLAIGLALCDDEQHGRHAVGCLA